MDLWEPLKSSGVWALWRPGAQDSWSISFDNVDGDEDRGKPAHGILAKEYLGVQPNRPNGFYAYYGDEDVEGAILFGGTVKDGTVALRSGTFNWCQHSTAKPEETDVEKRKELKKQGKEIRSGATVLEHLGIHDPIELKKLVVEIIRSMGGGHQKKRELFYEHATVLNLLLEEAKVVTAGTYDGMTFVLPPISLGPLAAVTGIVSGMVDIYAGIKALSNEHGCKAACEHVLFRIVHAKVSSKLALNRRQYRCLDTLDAKMRGMRDNLSFHATTTGATGVTGGTIGIGGGTTLLVGSIIGGPVTMIVGGAIAAGAGIIGLTRTVATSCNDYGFRGEIWKATKELARIKSSTGGCKLTFEVSGNGHYIMLVQYKSVNPASVQAFLSCDADCSWKGGTMELEPDAEDIYVQFQSRAERPVYMVDRTKRSRPWMYDSQKNAIKETFYFKKLANGEEKTFVLKTNASNAWVHEGPASDK